MADHNDALILLAQDHLNVRRLLADLVDDPELTEERRIRLLEELDTELEVHNRLEEELFYPALLRKTTRSELRRRVAEACAEHRAAARMMAPAVDECDLLTEDEDEVEVPDLATRREADAAMRVVIERHCAEEEADLFSLARSLLTEPERVELGRKMVKRRQMLFDQRLGA